MQMRYNQIVHDIDRKRMQIHIEGTHTQIGETNSQISEKIGHQNTKLQITVNTPSNDWLVQTIKSKELFIYKSNTV